jgi:hypothetical protein
MKVFTKLGIAFLVMMISSSMLWAQSSIYDLGPKKATSPIVSDAQFDLQFDWPVGIGGGEAGIETNGNYIYTSKWNGTGEYYKYQMDGTYIGPIMVTGAAAARDLAFDGTYFYGAAAATTVFQMDLDNAVKISQFTAPIAVRAIAYNEDESCFYGNNWSDNITKFNMAGANLGSWACGASAPSYYGFAYDNYSPGAPFLWGYSQTGTTMNELVQMALPSGAETGVFFDVGSVAAVGTGIAGGLCISNTLVSGFYTIMGTAQNIDIWGLELCPSGPALTDDIGISAIVSPESGVNLGNAIPVTVTIKNFGTDPQSNFPISYTMDGGAPVNATITSTIVGGATLDYTFTGTVDLSVYGTYDFEACTYLVGDENTGNDCKSKSVTNGPPLYCDASTTTEDEYISNVLCGDIDNSSGWQGGIADYTDISTTIDPGLSEDITVTNPTPYAADMVTCWVDWNMDYTFGTGDEEFILTNVGGTGASFTGAITVPAATPGGDYRMRVRMTYSTAPTPCGSSTYGEVEDYTIVVSGGGTSNVFEYDFENFTAGGQVACQFPAEWTTWSNAPCGTEDAYVSTDYAFSGVNSVKVTGVNDLVKELGDLASGHYKLSFQMYIPTGNLGYFNILQDFAGASSQWGMQVYLGDDNTGPTPGVGWIDGGGALAASFNFDYDTWNLIEADIDLDQDWAEFYFNGALIHGYVWSSGTFGTGTLNELDGVDFFAFAGVGGTPLYYIDDFTMEDLSGPPLPAPTNLAFTVTNNNDVHLTWSAPGGATGLQGYNIYRNATNIDYVAAPTTTYDDLDLAVGTYIYYVKAVYAAGESPASNSVTVVIENLVPPAPTNLVATGVTNGIQLTWDPVGSGEWIQWDAGVNNGNGIGLTSGGTFSVAAHWTPADLTPYNGFSLQKVQFFPLGDPAATFVIKVWSGVNGTTLLHTQNVTSYTVDEFNEVVLTTPVLINTTTDFWIGYTVTHGAGTFPAGTDDGPAVGGKGDMISLSGGAWVAMGVTYGLDYNWNLAGFVGVADGKNAPLQPMVETIAPVNNNGSFWSSVENGFGNGQSVKFIPNSTKDFLYNVYHKVQGGTYAKLNANPIAVTTYLHATPPQGWNYYVVRTVLNGVESLNSNEVSLNWTSIEEMVFDMTQVYPNPANGIVNIKSEFNIKSVRVFNHAGQTVANESADTKFYQFNASQFTPGLYMFQIETNEGTITKRIIIE